MRVVTIQGSQAPGTFRAEMITVVHSREQAMALWGGKNKQISKMTEWSLEDGIVIHTSMG